MNDDTVPDVGMTIGLDEAKPSSPRRTICAKAVAAALAAVAAFTASAEETIPPMQWAERHR